jgi:acyl transferase domain-containing protein
METIIRAALTGTGSPDVVSRLVMYEAHGIGSPLWDANEAQALRGSFLAARHLDISPAGGGATSAPPVVLGAGKSQYGHLGAAAGVAGCVRALLSLTNRKAPPNLHLRQVSAPVAAALRGVEAAALFPEAVRARFVLLG